MSGDWRARALDWMTGRLDAGALPVSVGSKFSATGEVLSYRGNTFICHIDPASEAFDALTEAQAALRAGLPAGAYTFMPPPSFHMTVFGGICDACRTDARWPEGTDPDTPVDAVTDRWLAKAQALSLPQSVTIAPLGIFGGFCVLVDGAAEADRTTLWSVRNTLREATGIRRPDFDTYRFHITLAYNTRWLTAAEARAAQDLSDHVHERLRHRAAIIALGPVEFCAFDDMHRFRTLHRIGA
ncbi:MAG: DUF1868 domain-containing protein [Rubellimicrobium sp.]|nr:DUF1868 domain-containing protein [Rubellimicrobium sp.]